MISCVTGSYLASDKPFPRGEILVGGGNVVMGYYTMEEKMKGDFTEFNGIRYFCTGDIGQIEEDGCLRVIGKMRFRVQNRGRGGGSEIHVHRDIFW